MALPTGIRIAATGIDLDLDHRWLVRVKGLTRIYRRQENVLRVVFNDFWI